MKSIKFILFISLNLSIVASDNLKLDELENSVNSMNEKITNIADSIKITQNRNLSYIFDKYSDNENIKLLKGWLIIALQAKGDGNLSYFISSTKYDINILLQKISFDISDEDFEVINEEVKNVLNSIDIEDKPSTTIPKEYSYIVNRDLPIRKMPIDVKNSMIEEKVLNRSKLLKIIYTIEYTNNNKVNRWGYVSYNDKNDKCWVDMKCLSNIKIDSSYYSSDVSCQKEKTIKKMEKDKKNSNYISQKEKDNTITSSSSIDYTQYKNFNETLSKQCYPNKIFVSPSNEIDVKIDKISRYIYMYNCTNPDNTIKDKQYCTKTVWGQGQCIPLNKNTKVKIVGISEDNLYFYIKKYNNNVLEDEIYKIEVYKVWTYGTKID